MDSDQVLELNYENFDDEVYGGSADKPAVIEFYSESSYACRELRDIIDDLAREYAGKIIFGRVDLESNWQTADLFNVKTAPAVLLIQHKRVIERIEGPRTREEYRRELNALVTQFWEI